MRSFSTLERVERYVALSPLRAQYKTIGFSTLERVERYVAFSSGKPNSGAFGFSTLERVERYVAPRVGLGSSQPNHVSVLWSESKDM